MKNIISFNSYFNINENNNEKLFKNEKLLFEYLIQDSDFANGDIYQGLINVFFKEWQNNDSYDIVCQKVEDKYGKFARFLLQFGMYQGQINNGGHYQYFDNGYASYGSEGFGKKYENIDLHNKLYDLFKTFNFENILTDYKKLKNILSSFELEMNNLEETCWECDGNGYISCEECDSNEKIECEECNGSGFIETDEEFAETYEWDQLDEQYYNIENSVMADIEKYLENLTLNGEKLKKIAKIAKEKNKYNI